jgi:hypothetical protein
MRMSFATILERCSGTYRSSGLRRIYRRGRGASNVWRSPPGFIVAELLGAFAATILRRWLVPSLSIADDSTITDVQTPINGTRPTTGQTESPRQVE